MSIPRKIARVGDKHICPAHGVNRIVQGSTSSTINGKGIARLGDLCECGCAIVTVSSTSTLDGRGVAHEGSLTTLGGVIVECTGIATLV